MVYVYYIFRRGELLYPPNFLFFFVYPEFLISTLVYPLTPVRCLSYLELNDTLY